MQLSFERGDPKRPRGHALVYFRANDDPGQILASYVVVPPISLDFSRYIPPMFAAQFGGMIPTGPSAFPLPPFPERVESLAWVEETASARGDDLIDGGTVDANDVQRLLILMTDLAGEYARLYESRPAGPPEPEPEREPAALPSVDVDELLLSLMTDREKVEKLARLIGTVRYAAEGGDGALLDETVGEMERVGRQLGERYRVAELTRAVRDPGQRGGRLAELLLQRCFKLASEEYDTLAALDREIEALRGDADTPPERGEVRE
ncbi:MAG: hypothetical protein M3O34_07035 [Chloroflexota bacterium]|nr:hypothetical protein [Chloroflexota bacterium]